MSFSGYRFKHDSRGSIKHSRAQVSVEYLIIFGIAFMMTLPLIVIYARQTNNFQADVSQIQIYTIESKISDYAEQVYYMGEPSQRTLYVDFPKGINGVTLSEHLIIFNVTTADLNYDVVKETTANITGSIGHFPGEHIIIFTAQSTAVNVTER